MTFNQIREAIKACYRGPDVFTHNKALDALDLHAKYPEHFYSDNDKRLKDRVFVHNPHRIPHKAYLFEELTEEQKA